MNSHELPPFVPGIKLCEVFFQKAVQPLLEKHQPTLVFSAGRLDRGSDVIGMDTAQSRDHHWGPKVMLFLEESDYLRLKDELPELLASELPREIDGYPTHFDNPDHDGGSLKYQSEGPLSHGVTITTPTRFSKEYLGVDTTKDFDELAWLSMPAQRLLTVYEGKVFHDGLNILGIMQDRLKWYPHDIWLYLMSNQWRRIDQEEPFLARCGDVGDSLGSRLVAARQIVELIKLAFLQERKYPPYYKWFGSAFAKLACAKKLTPIFYKVLDAQEWRDREAALSDAYLYLGELHNTLSITKPVEVKLSQFWSRPYIVPHSERFVEALRAEIRSPRIKALPAYIGAVDQFVNSTDVSDSLEYISCLAGIYTSAT